MAEYQGSTAFEPSWADPADVRQYIDRELLTGEVLNVCCGQSPIGDVRVDVDPDHEPDVLADVHNLPFEPQSFDTVYCDPPFTFYTFSEGYWPADVWALARERLILNSPAKRVAPFKGSRKRWIVLEPNPGSPGMFIRTLQVFDRANHRLEDVVA